MAITYYYPEGPFGPICDIFIDDADDGLREVRPDDGDGRQPTYGPLDFDEVEKTIGEPAPFLTSRRCRVRTLADGTEEYYDCIDDLTIPISPPPDFPLIEPQYNWPGVSTLWGIDDVFEPIEIGPEVCSPFDPDVNITPVKFFKADGTFVLKTQVERSSPVTFPVSDGSPSTIISKIVNAEFVDEGLHAYFLADGTGIQVDGTGTGTITLEFDWDDSPSISGQSVGSMTIGGQTFSQSGSRGNQTRSFSIAGGNAYYWTFSGQSSTAGFIVDDGGQSISFDDDAGNGFDVNSTLRISNITTNGGALLLRVTGETFSGTAQVGLRLEWDDNPNTSGLAVGAVTVAGATLTQQGEKGSEEVLLDLVPGTDYPLTVTNNTNTQSNEETSYPIEIAANGDKGRGDFAVVKSVSNDTIKFTDASFQMDTDSELKIKSTSSGVSAEFDGSDENDLELIVTGTGTVTLEFEWDDDTNTNGKSVGELYIDGQTIDQSGDEGEEEITINVGSGGGGGANPTAGYRLVGTQTIEWDDDATNGFDINATLSITGQNPAESEKGPGAWNDDADLYAVWVNPEVCTLPCLPQTVTYFIDIPETDTYTITGGADDEFQVFLNDSNTAIIGGPAGIFEPEHELYHTGKYTPPYSAQTTLTKGTLKMVVNCTNSAAGFGSCDGAGATFTTVPLYRYVNSTTGDHFTGTDETAPSGYVNEGILCHLFTYPFPGSFQVVDREPGKPQSSYTLYGFSPFQGPDFDIQGEPVATTLIYAKSNGNDVMWTSTATEGDSDSPAYALDTTNNENGYAFYGASSATTIVLEEGVAPYGNAYRWYYNPGGWYIKICRGTKCIESTSIDWVHSGPNGEGQWGEFMDKYAVYPSNSNVLLGVDHAATYNVLIPAAGDYILQWGMDDDGTISLDGNQIISSGYEPNSQTYTISNLSAGPHTIGVTIRNNGPSGDWIKNPGGIAWTLVPAESDSSVSWTISGQNSDAGYRIRNNGQRIQWDDDASGNFDVNATMDIGKVTQLMGSNVSVSFRDDGTGLDVTGSGEADVRLDFEWDDKTSISGLAVGSLSIGGQTFTQSGTKGSTSKTITVKAGDVVASSLDLEEQTTEGNLIWHTRKATGYEYVEIT
ncbi:PA14 domain-containing protein [Synechococcus phage S-CAM22]|uniref:PA14 domain-containing protein n=1 Tax=Synechococcus phage S-CAM22 TaxID=1883365 RepID=A0A1D8KS54_9CAUD|nr:major head protein [Synechococcus phage S-CAM22]AOV61459.1 PA14 domain-containing protein [Synechococcus phage S-CAM22]